MKNNNTKVTFHLGKVIFVVIKILFILEPISKCLPLESLIYNFAIHTNALTQKFLIAKVAQTFLSVSNMTSRNACTTFVH